MNLIKKQGIGAWISLGVVVLSVIALIIYGVAISGGMDLIIASGSQPFYEATRPEDTTMMTMVVTCGIISLVFTVAAIVLAQFKFDGIVGTVVNTVVGALRIVAPALLIATFLYFAYGSFTGLGWTFGSNEELEIFAAAKAVGTQVIVGLVFFVLAAIAGIVGSFFTMVKQDA